jgi:hypothetical protein
VSETIEYNKTSQSLYFVLTNSTTGARLTGVAHTDVNASYTREKSARVAVTEESLANAQAAYASGGWVEVDSTNQPGLYRFDCPDAAFVYASGVTKVLVTITATGAHSETKEIELVPPVITQGSIGASLDAQPTYNQYTFVDGTVRKDYV